MILDGKPHECDSLGISWRGGALVGGAVLALALAAPIAAAAPPDPMAGIKATVNAGVGKAFMAGLFGIR